MSSPSWRSLTIKKPNRNESCMKSKSLLARVLSLEQMTNFLPTYNCHNGAPQRIPGRAIGFCCSGGVFFQSLSKMQDQATHCPGSTFSYSCTLFCVQNRKCRSCLIPWSQMRGLESVFVGFLLTINDVVWFWAKTMTHKKMSWSMRTTFVF